MYWMSSKDLRLVGFDSSFSYGSIVVRKGCLAQFFHQWEKGHTIKIVQRGSFLRLKVKEKKKHTKSTGEIYRQYHSN